MEDNQVFMDDETGDIVIFNGYSFNQLIKHIMIKYAAKSEAEAQKLVTESRLLNQPVDNAMSVYLYSHELPYHWAMLVAHGDMYWLRGEGIKSNYNDFVDEYELWEDNIMVEFRLKEPFIFLDNVVGSNE